MNLAGSQIQVPHAAQQTTVIRLQALPAHTFFQWDSFYCPALFIIFTINQSILKTGVNFIRKQVYKIDRNGLSNTDSYKNLKI